MSLIPAKEKLKIGNAKDDRMPVKLDQKLRSQHMHVLGSTGTGKSRFLRSLIQQDILAGRGVCVIDPHGTLCKQVVDWLSNRKKLIENRAIHFVQPANLEHAFAFNPLKSKSSDNIATVVDSSVTALGGLQGSESMLESPLLEETMWAVSYALASAGLTLVEANFLLMHHHEQSRYKILEHLKNPYFIDLWERYNEMRPREYNDYFSAASRRFSHTQKTALSRRIFGQNDNACDFKSVMDNGEIFLLDLSNIEGRLPGQDSEVIGRLVINNLMARAFERPAEEARPFHLYIDEAQLFLSGDVPKILAEMRKYGLHLCLSHQNLGQLRKAGEYVYDGVMANARTKVIFGLDDAADAELLVDRVFAGHFNYERPKHTLTKPVVTGYRREWLDSFSSTDVRLKVATEGESKTDTLSSARGGSEGHSDVANKGEGSNTGLVLPVAGGVDSDALRVVESASKFSSDSSANSSSSNWANSDSFSETQTKSTGDTTGENKTEGSSQTLVPELMTMPQAVYSLEENRHQFKQILLLLEGRNGFLLPPGQKSVGFKTVNVPDEYTSAKKLERVKAELFSSSAYHVSSQQVDQMIIERQKKLFDVALDEASPEKWGA